MKKITIITALCLSTIGLSAKSYAYYNTDELRKDRTSAYLLPAGDKKPDEPPRVLNPKPKPPAPTKSPDEPSQPSNQAFEMQRGHLIPPVVGGHIVSPFGQYSHPTEPKVTMDNRGIDIAAKEGTPVRNVFHGTVARIENIGGTYTVIIKHGDYYTVYSYLSKVNVKVGDQLATKAEIGLVGKNDDGKYTLHFEIAKWDQKNIINENPILWVKGL